MKNTRFHRNLIVMTALVLALAAAQVFAGHARLGIMVIDDDDGVVIKAVLPGTAAERAGLLAGDRLLDGCSGLFCCAGAGEVDCPASS